MPPKLSLGLNLPGKKPPGARPPPSLGQKRKKTIFDDDSDEDAAAESKGSGDNAVEITSIGGLEEPIQPAPSTKPSSTAPPPAKRKIPFGQQAAAKPSAKPLTKSSIFADDDEDDNNNKTTSEQLDKDSNVQFGLNPSKPSTAEYTNLSALHSSRKHAQQAEDLDPSIYSYDAVYDSLQAAKPQKNKSKKSGAEGEEEEVPRYMTSLLRSAEVRKRDQLRARDRMLAKEREAEGDEFADKEKFVTAAYKAQQEEMRRVEQEEAERERAEAERRKKNGDVGMLGFYRDVLSRGEEEHAAAMRAADEAAKRVKEGVAGTEEEEKEKEASKEKTEAQVAAELNARGARVAVNDEGSVVDKRQLLSAGLNVAPKPKAAPSAAPGGGAARPAAKVRADGAPTSGRAGQRARQTEMIAAQLEKQAQEEAAAEAAKQKELEERSRSRKSGTDVSSARERFLARKKEREAAAKGK
ncbi:hypothetical protein P168DRAFT_272225 [Aspergillus campestris IBT 28561]|uniref:Nuclear speckle splicing regulatory protein 1 N-terminal domain-containing protein n=1 Tax=Aspergillus campestris (strain IBT 28561) TaxID=1392248 RepID=A0A2I1CYQ9_ASPC2|nr:uncharacterized protein P168DRAFT_272225 [Aspergillus campestris IBT 28561]PKY02746.1 hypothetical protein P168DRAFT_272225 [Aspergillus campestris IBT 28561]